MTIIASDIDGVLINIEPAISRRIAKHFGVPANDVKKNKFYMWERFGIEFEDMEVFLRSDECYGGEAIWLEAEPFKDNVTNLMRAFHKDVSNRLILITGRHNACREVTVKSLVSMGIYYDALLMDTLDVKHKAIKYCGANFMMEDKYSEAKTIGEAGHSRSYLLRRPYNEEHMADSAKEVIWATDVADVLKTEGLL